MTPLEAAVLILICFGMAIWGSLEGMILGASKEGLELLEGAFSDSSMLFLAVIEVVLAATALLFLRIRGFDLSVLYPSPNVKGILNGIFLFFVATFLSYLVAIPFALESGNEPIRKIVEHSHPSFPVLLTASVVNGAYEEVFLLGAMIGLMRNRYGAGMTAGISVALRMFYHLYQGPVAAMSVAVFGLVLSVYYVRTRNLWPAVVAHIAADFLAFAFR